MTANEYMKKIKDNLDSVEQNLEQIQCDDCISRHKAIVAITACDGKSAQIEAIEKLPSVTPQPKTGQWIEQIDHEENCRTLICSNCDRPALHDGDSIWKHKFCPHCGAKMVEPQETETWNGYHGQITAPKGTFEKIYEDAESEDQE